MVATFKFVSDAVDKDLFDVLSFSGTEGLSQLYRYEIQVKALTSRVIDLVEEKGLEDFLDEMLDHTVRLITEEGGVQYPVSGMLASFDENQTAGGYTYYTAVLVPRLWKCSIYRTNEIYTTEKTVDQIIETVLDQFDFIDGRDYALSLSGKLMEKDYICQFGETDFHFISRLMENEGIYYYFEQGESSEKLMIVDGADYAALAKPDAFFDVNAQAGRRHENLFSWSRRTRRLPSHVSVRDYNPDQPSLDVHGTVDVETLSDASGSGDLCEYLYGDNFSNEDEAARLALLRAEEIACRKTRYYGEGAVCGFRPGYTFKMGQHPNPLYNSKDYLLIEVSHEGRGLDSKSDSSKSQESGPQYRNTFVAIEKHISFRPPLQTKKPRFFGTMTAFVYAEAETGMAEIDEQGRYRVHLPFDRADGGKESSDPDRKASCWVRMAQPYVGDNQGMYFPLKNGTEVLLTFINGDPDQPIIAAALPNAATPSLLNSESNLARISTPNVFQQISGTLHTFVSGHNPGGGPATSGTHYINDPKDAVSMLPPWTETPGYVHDPNLIKMKTYLNSFITGPDVYPSSRAYSSDRGGGDNYVYANARTFAYPQHERVYFIGTFHEDFHIKDGFTDPDESYTGQSEVFHFPEPGGDGTQKAEDGTQKTECAMNPTGIRGVSEDRRWGDQMFYAWGRTFNWSGGAGLGVGGAVEAYNYGNGYTENLLCEMGGTSEDADFPLRNHNDKMAYDAENGWSPADDVFGPSSGWPGFAAKAIGWVNSNIKWVFDHADRSLDSRRLPTDALRDARRLFPNTTAVEKTFGNTYSYQAGLAVDIHEGHSIARTYGDSEEVVTGDTNSVVHGDSYETVVGNQSGFFMGASTAISLAESFELYGGLKQELALAATFTGHVGFETGLQLAGFLKYTLGAGVDVTQGPIFEGKQFDAEAAITKLNTSVAEIKKTQAAEIVSSTVRIDKIVTGLNSSSVCDIQTGMLTMFQ